MDKYIAFGDSLTNGYGVTPKNTWRDHVGNYFGIEIKNYGVNGQTASEAKSRLNEIILAQPTVVFINFGTNDMIQSQDNKGFVSLNQYEKNMRALIEPLLKEHIKVIWLSVHKIIEGDPIKRTFFYSRHEPKNYISTKPNEILKACRDRAKQVSSDLNVQFIDLYSDERMHDLQNVLLTSKNFETDDGVHFSDYGSKIVSEIIIEQVEGELK